MIENCTPILLAGGKGTRLRPLTFVFPKPLVPLGDSPIIDIVIKRLSTFGFPEIIISTGYMSELIRAVCGNGEKYGVKLKYLNETSPRGTAGSLSMATFDTEHCIAINGDILTTLNFERMLESHVHSKSDITIGVQKRFSTIDYGVVLTEQDTFVGFEEKPTLSHNVSMGVNILHRDILTQIEKCHYLDMPDLILRVHRQGGKVTCYQEDCQWLDVGRIDDFAKAQTLFESSPDEFLKK